MKKTALPLLAGIVMVLLCAPNTPANNAVPNAELALKIAAARKANAALMKQYNWNCRTELLVDGNVKDIRIDLVTYGPDGSLQRTLLNDQGSPMPRGFLRRMIAKEKKKEMDEYITGLRQLLDQYTLPTAGKILDFISQATITGTKTPDGSVVLQMTGNGVVVPGDTFTLTVDPATHHTRSINITTSYQGSAVTVTGSFKTNRAGLSYLQYGQVDIPDKSMSLQLQNFDYEKND